MTHVIHFVDIDDMLEEYDGGYGLIRVGSLMDREQSRSNPAAVNHTSFILARGFRNSQRKNVHDDVILSWFYVIGSIEVVPGEEGDPVGDLAEMSREMSEILKEYIENAGVSVREGIIDLGSVIPLGGVWRHWEEMNQDQESEEQPE